MPHKKKKKRNRQRYHPYNGSENIPLVDDIPRTMDELPKIKNTDLDNLISHLAMEEDKGLTKNDIQHFIENGFVILRNAFPVHIATAGREELWKYMCEKDDIQQNDPNTWKIKYHIPEIYDEKNGYPWNEVFTLKLRNSIDQLCGKDRWNEFGCGWWVITFPGFVDPNESWGAAGHWHIDGGWYQHFLHSKESGLLPIFMFSDTGPTEGGTALSAGSHLTVARILMENPEGLKGGHVSRLANQFPIEKIVELNGKAGDVLLAHPMLLHARSKNMGMNGSDSVRFICNPNVSLKNEKNLWRNDFMEYSPVEVAILKANECIIK